MTKHYLITALLALIPISEVRGAIPYGYFNGIPMVQVVIISMLMNMMVPLIGFAFLSTLHKLLIKWPVYERIFNKFDLKARNKVGDKVRKYGLLGLTIFVAIPLPITGAWTGVLGAWVLKLDIKKSIPAIMLGVLIATIIVTTVILTGSGLASLFTKQF